MSAKHTLIRVAEFWYYAPHKPWVCPKPGQAYERLPESVKEVLKDLKSDDISDVRPLE